MKPHLVDAASRSGSETLAINCNLCISGYQLKLLFHSNFTYPFTALSLTLKHNFKKGKAFASLESSPAQASSPQRLPPQQLKHHSLTIELWSTLAKILRTSVEIFGRAPGIIRRFHNLCLASIRRFRPHARVRPLRSFPGSPCQLGPFSPSRTVLTAIMPPKTYNGVKVSLATPGATPNGTPSSSARKRSANGQVKYYAVRAGHTPGVFTNYADVQRSTTGFKGAICKYT